ncbi:PAS domain-containing protein [Sphingomonas sp. R647]|uniref:ATP-binding protein n=1 Tax=Sphingomonas sp. R647 TaxID=2875233 RepID=UPI001CD61A56|nr:ATP-binding protein [Sphingomonas sp. R647]MCA1200135.1 PAS domain-containing protein [Sphingomonas sp. R647]
MIVKLSEWMSDRTRIFVGLGTAFVLAMIWSFVIGQVSAESDDAMAGATDRNRDRTQILQQYVNRTLNTARLASLHVGSLKAKGAFDSEKNLPVSLAADPIASDPTFLGLRVIDARGALVASTIEQELAGSGQKQRSAALGRRVRDGVELAVSRTVDSPLLGRPTIWLSRHLRDSAGRSVGTVEIGLEPSQLTAVFGTGAAKPNENAWVVGSDGFIRARMSNGKVTSDQDVRHGELFRRQQRSDEGSFVSRGAIDPRPRLISYRRVPGYDLFVSYSTLQDAALKVPRVRATILILGAGLTSFAVLALAALFLRGLRLRERNARELALAKTRMEEAQRVARIGDWARKFNPDQLIWSPQLYAMYEREPALGPMETEFTEMLRPDSVERLNEAVDRVTRLGEPATWEMQVRLPSGRTRVHLASAVPTMDTNGNIIGFHGTTQDITDQKRQEALQEDLTRLARTGAMNALAATISHELNQPLTAARNNLASAQMALDGTGTRDDTKAIDRLKTASQQIGLAGQIIQRMRKLVMTGESEHTLVRTDELITEALAIIMAARICPFEIGRKEPAVEFHIRVDCVQIQQVLLNLVRNACEAQVGSSDTPPVIEVTKHGARSVRIMVIDHGPGFPEEMIENLAEPFATSKEGGLGLGLTIARTIIEAHGGSLFAQNRPGGGAAVGFTLPLEDPRLWQLEDGTAAARAETGPDRLGSHR